MSTFSDSVCVYSISLYICLTVSVLSMTQSVFLQLVSVERTNLSIPPLSSPLCPPLSPSLLYSSVLHSSCAAITQLVIVHEKLNWCACVWNRYGDGLLERYLCLMMVCFCYCWYFQSFFCLWRRVHRRFWVACSDFSCVIVMLVVVDVSILPWRGL